MKFYSTNHIAQPVSFEGALFSGLAEDGGLYMPGSFGAPLSFSYYRDSIEATAILLKRFTGIPKSDLLSIVRAAFDFPVPLVQLDRHLFVLELFHGPTLSFKDFGARFMARCFQYYLMKRKRSVTIVVATSGDTGSAVAAAFYRVPRVRVVVLYPFGRVSALQEKQMTTFGHNIHAIAVRGDFDDCQRLAKRALADLSLSNMSSANSINIGRLLPQMYYYFFGYMQLMHDFSGIGTPLFVVPSGNFGNVAAGLFARRLGLPVTHMLAAVNRNSVVPKYLAAGTFRAAKTRMTLSSAMDVGNPSNWARIMDLYGLSRAAIARDLSAATISESMTKKTIARIRAQYGYIVDPHTAVGLAAAMQSEFRGAKIVLATAHPAKFISTVPIPCRLRSVLHKREHKITIDAHYAALRDLCI